MPETVKSPATVKLLPMLAFWETVNWVVEAWPVTARLVEVALVKVALVPVKLVKVPAAGVVAPMTVLSIVPALIVKLSATSESCQSKDKVPELASLSLETELSAKDVIVESNGMVSLPYIGNVNLLGLTLQQAERRIEALLSKDLQNPKVSIKRTQKAIRQVTVEGAVKTPGVFPIVSSMTFLQAIAMSQGITDLADVTHVFVFRDGIQYAVDLYKVRHGLSPDPVLKQNDRIVVLKSNRKVKEKKVLEYLPALLTPLSLIM